MFGFKIILTFLHILRIHIVIKLAIPLNIVLIVIQVMALLYPQVVVTVVDTAACAVVNFKSVSAM